MDFLKPFRFSGNIAFGIEYTYSATFNVTLAKPTCDFICSNINQVTFNVTLAKPETNFELVQSNLAYFNLVLDKPQIVFSLSNLHLVNANSVLPKPQIDFGLSNLHLVNADNQLKKISVSFSLSTVDRVYASAIIQNPSLNFEVIYDNNVWRGLTGRINARTSITSAIEAETVKSFWIDARKGVSSNQSKWNSPAELQSLTDSLHKQSEKIDSKSSILFMDFANNISDNFSSSFIQLKPFEGTKASIYKLTDPIENQSSSNFIQLFVKDTFRDFRYKRAKHLTKSLKTKTGIAREFDHNEKAFWSYARILNGISSIIQPIIIPPEPTIFQSELNFIYDFLFTPDIEFKRKLVKNRIITKRFYYMLHQIAVRRKSDQKRISVNRLDLSTDVDSWGWRLSATVIGKQSYLDVKDAMPLEIEVSINGYQWTFVVLDIKESKTFGNNAYSLTGLSTGAYLGEIYNSPKAFSFNESRTIEQLMNLQLPNDWQEVDYAGYNWSVPAYSYANQTPIQSIMELAKVSGSFVHNDKNLKKLFVQKKYPNVPWNFENMLSDYVLPVNPIISMSKEFQKGKNYNAVYVAGTDSNGILGYVKIDGTAGDIIPDAPLSHQLIVHNDAARAYGKNFLIENFDKWKYGIELPLGGDIPLFTLGALVKVLEDQIWKGILTDLSISVSVAEREVAVRQKINLERFE